MKISVDIARTIVREISNTIHQNVNLMDESGYIIASTNPARTGTRHVGAQKIISEQLEYLTINTDGEYEGAKSGINMPLYFGREIVGVLGITGEWDQIKPYIDLIRKTSETLLMNFYLQRREGEIQKEQNQYLYHLLSEDVEHLPKDFISMGTRVGIDMLTARRCICISFRQGQGMQVEKPHIFLEQTEQTIHQIQGYPRQSFSYREADQLAVFVPIEKKEEIERLIAQTAEKLKLPAGVTLKAGVDVQPSAGMELRRGKERAQKSLKAAMLSQERDVVYYHELTFGVFISEIPDESKREYLARVFKGITDTELQYWMELLEIFYACEGSITRTAEKMFIHKNTLQYQLKKLKSVTGYDPRSISNAAIYQNALWFWKELL